MDYFAGLDISMDETHVCVLVVRKNPRPRASRSASGSLIAEIRAPA